MSRRRTRALTPAVSLVATGSLAVAVFLAGLLAGLLAGVGPLAPPAQAGPTGLQTLAPAGTGVSVVSDGVGNAVAAWLVAGQVQVARRPAGQPAWSPATTLTQAGEAAGVPDVSIGSGGQVAVAWSGTLSAGAQPEIRLAYQPLGQPWTPTRTVTENNQPDLDPQVDVGPAGIATLVWPAATETRALIRSKTASATTASETRNLFEQAGTASAVVLARGATGDVVAAWRFADASGSYVGTTRRPNGLDWSAVSNFGPYAAVPDAPSAAVDAGGNALLGFAAGVTADTAVVHTVSWLRAAPGPNGPAPRSVPGGRDAQVAVNDSGGTGVAWRQPDGLAYADAGGAPAIVAGVPTDAVSLSIGVAGTVAIGFSTPSGWFVADRPPGAGFTVTAFGGAPGSRGGVVVHGADSTSVWSEGPGGPVSARMLDTGAPTAVHLTGPLAPFNLGTTIRAGWIGLDTWSPIRYDVRRSVTSYAGKRKPLTPTPWRSFTGLGSAFKVKPGRTVCLAVSGTDTAGNPGPLSVPRCTTTPQDDRVLERGKGWKVRKLPGTYKSTYLVSRQRGARLTLSKVRASRVALLVTTGKQDGSVTVRFGKRSLGTHSLASSRPGKQVVVPVGSFPGQRKGTLTVTVSTAGRPVRIDGVYLAAR